MSDKPRSNEPVVFMGEVSVGMKELHDAIDAADRLLNPVYEVEYRAKAGAAPGAKERFIEDVVAVAQMLRQLTLAITQAKPVGGNGEVH